MSTCTSVIQLVNALSASEKRQVSLAAKKQSGERDYMVLFDVINKTNLPEIKTVADLFYEKRPKASIEASAAYLIKVVTDCLIHAKADKDNEYELFQSLMRVKILQERSLHDEANKELNKLKKKAAERQHHHVHYMALRMEQDFMADQNFPGLTDKALTEMQMRSKESLRVIRNIEEHYALFGQIKFRLNSIGRIITAGEKNKLNDLVLSEISLVGEKMKTSFASRKVHLLFQAFYFTHIGDHRSSLKCFHELTQLFKQNPTLRDNPPTDHFTTLEGILDNIRTMGNFEEMPAYIAELEKLGTDDQPEYFKYLLKKTTANYTIACLLGAKSLTEAGAHITSLPADVFSTYQAIHHRQQAEWAFYQGLLYFERRELKKAHKAIKTSLAEKHSPSPQPIHRAIRLLNIVIHYELGDIDYLEYEIRSYTRTFILKRNLSGCEKIVFKTIQLHPYKNSFAKNKLLAKKITSDATKIRADKKEILLKYMNWPGWAESRFY